MTVLALKNYEDKIEEELKNVKNILGMPGLADLARPLLTLGQKGRQLSENDQEKVNLYLIEIRVAVKLFADRINKFFPDEVE